MVYIERDPLCTFTIFVIISGPFMGVRCLPLVFKGILGLTTLTSHLLLVVVVVV